MNTHGLATKLSSRKFLLTLLGVILTFVAQTVGMEVPWEAISLIVAYIFGEAGVDAIRMVRGGNKA